MMVMPIGLRLLGINILAESSFQYCAFHIMRGQCVSGQNGMNIAILNETDHRTSGVMVKGNGRAKDPNNITVFFFILQ
jgi:hypothetical protein